MPAENRLLVIGIDEYPGRRYNRIVNAKIDTNRLIKVFTERYGFILAQAPLYDVDASYDNVRDAILDLTASTAEGDNIIIYYAGHGDQNPYSKKGYWIPYDAENDQKKYILNSTILDDLEGVPAKHILLISDCCYSGTFITRVRTPGKTLTHDELDALSSRWVFVSGEETPVSDGVKDQGSPFGISLSKFLEKNMAMAVAAGEVFDAVMRDVENKGGQQPQASPIRSEAHEGGQMILRLQIVDQGGDNPPTLEPVKFFLPEEKVEYYIPRLLTYYDFQESKEFKFYQPEVGKIYLNSLIKSEKRIAILGGAGSGKSVEMLYQAHNLQNKDDGLNPIYKRFNTYTEENIGDYLPVGWKSADPGTLVLFLDGLDEIQPKYFQTAIRKITSFAEENILVRMVITCRNNFYELPYKNFSGTLEGFSVYTLNDVSIAEITTYVTDNFELDGKDFVEKVHANSFLDLVQKPFFLNILVRYYKDNGNFDSGRPGIMEEALLKYYDNDKQHFVSTIYPLNKTLLFSRLEKIAFVMEIMGKNFLTEADLFKLFVFDEEVERCKYLPAFKKQGDDDKWMFEHNNLQEYIASRILAQKKSNEIIELITVKTAGEHRVKPSWVNTLSFFISIGDDAVVADIMNWIIRHDREVIVKFESERLTDQQRISLFKDIFNFYTDKQIWLRSNNFSDKDMARFGESKEVLEFLLSFIESSEANRIAKLNSLHVLSNYQLIKFSEYTLRVAKAVSGLINEPNFTSGDIYSVLGAIADLKIDVPDLLALIIDKYRNRRNQYIRAGMYKLLIHSKAVDDYVDIFIDGIDLTDLDSPSDDRDAISLFDETLYMRVGLESISTGKAISRVLLKLSDSENKREILLSDYQEIIASLMKTAKIQFNSHPELFDFVLNFYKSEAISHRSNVIKPLISFFDETQTKWQAFFAIWHDKTIEGYVKGMSIDNLIDVAIIIEFIASIKKVTKATEQIKEFYDFLLWYKRGNPESVTLLDVFELQVLENFEVVLERPVFKDWNLLRKKREQASFDLWFDDKKMLEEIGKVFLAINKEKVNRDDIFNYNHEFGADLEGKMVNSVNLVYNHLMHRGRIVTLPEIDNFVSLSEDYQNLKIGHIHADIFNKNDLNIDEGQIKYITDWCLTVGNDRKILWDFVNKFNVKLPEGTALELTKYTNWNYDVKLTEPGTIEQLEKFVSKVKLKDKILDNLKDPALDMLAWISNTGYALRNNFVTAYQDILKKLEQQNDYEYKFAEILDIWFAKTKNIPKLKELIGSVGATHLKWKAINMLEETGKEAAFLNELYHKMIRSKSDLLDDKIYAANHLMKQDDLFGFFYLANIILKNPDPDFDFRLKLGSISLLKNTEAVPTLMSLLEIAKQPEYKKDIFNDLEDRVLSALYNIGIQSNNNYLIVKTALNSFMEKNVGKVAYVNFLYFTIVKIEDQLKVKYMTSYTIDAALREYHLHIKN